MVLPPKIAGLIKKFDDNSTEFRNKDYNETRLRTDFINPFFEELGWDVTYNQSEDVRERAVLLEDSIRISGTKKRMDYAFLKESRMLFVVETKKPSVELEKNSEAAHQIRTYVYNANASLGILTNFREFAIYQRVKPSPDAAPHYGLLDEAFTYKELPEKWDWIEKTFGRENAYKEIDQYLAIKQGKKKLISVDDDILSEIEGWREVLARNIALRNREQDLNVDQLNAIVQRTIDRILFFRICEDRGIEAENTLFHLIESDHIYDKLSELFRDADIKYNSGLFHFRAEADWNEAPDILSEHVVLDDKILKEIIRDLYEPRSCYRWDIISPAILGQVYEQFLGKVIRLTEGGQAKIEFKPEVKKAGGVFYTPEFIVNYIVKHTVGELVNGKTPREVSSMRILDPACGSGSFLIGAYQYLLDWHLEWYRKNLVPVYLEKDSHSDPAVSALLPEPLPKKKTKGTPTEDKFPLYKIHSASPDAGSPGNWMLKTSEKKRILLNNIYGVDIDQQAVEVTKLSLMLKVLEEENSQNISKQLKLFAEPALPRLEQNIKCGNSLIGSDFFPPGVPIDEKEIKRINPFDWASNQGFAEIMKAGGFDAVIGNPPYVRQEILGPEFKDYAKKHYETYTGTADLYIYFFEKAHSLLQKGGSFGMICSNKFMRANYGKNLRMFLTTKSKLIQIIDFGELPVFQNASTFPVIITYKKEIVKNQNMTYAPIKNLGFSSLSNEITQNHSILDNKSITGSDWIFAGNDTILLFDKMKKISVPLGEYCKKGIFYGIKTGLNEAFVIDSATKKKILDDDPKSKIFIKPFIFGRDIQRYTPPTVTNSIIFIQKGFTNSCSGDKKNKLDWLKQSYPGVANYLLQFSEKAHNRYDQGDYWWELRSCSYFEQFASKKIIFPDIAKISRMTYDNNGIFADTTAFILPTEDVYLLGILNSKLIFEFYKRNSQVIGDADKGGRLRWKYQYIIQIPIRTINFVDTVDKARHDRMVALVTQMLDLNKKLKDAKLEHEKTLLQRQIEVTDDAINKLVYELYGLTPEEIAIVEGKTTTPVQQTE